jgi:hypothetical protein
MLLASVTGCAAAPEAPSDLGELTLFFFSEFETGDDAYLGEALLNLEAGTLRSTDLEGELSGRQWIQPILKEEHRGGAGGPDGIDPAAQVPVTVAGRSRFPVATHAGGVLEPDQSQLEPSAPEHDRTFPGDTACWAESSCERIDTDNLVKKSNILYTIVYETEKDFRRLTLPDGRAAMVARTWNDDVASGDEGVNSIDQNYAAEVFIEDADDPGQTLRMMAIWTSVTLAAEPTDELVRSIVGRGVSTLFGAHDDFYAEAADAL